MNILPCKIIAFSFLLFLNASCEKNSNKEPLPNTTNFEMKWQTSSSEEGYTFNFQPIIYNDIVIYSWHTTSPQVTPLVAYNKNTGEKKWEWSDFFYNPEYTGAKRVMYVYENKLVFSTTYLNLYCIDLNTGETLWRYESKGSRPQVRGYENFVLSTASNLSDGSDFYSAIFLTNINTGDIQEVKRFSMENGYRPELNTPLLYRNSIGELVYFQTYTLYNSSLEPEAIVNTIAYNIDREEIYFENEGMIDDIGYEYHDHKIYGSTYPNGSELICIDAETFEVLWEADTPGGIGRSGISFIKDNLIHGSEALDTGNEIYCRDKNTGELKWKSQGVAQSSRHGHYEGKIYFSNGNLFVLDLQNGSKLHTAISPDYEENEGAFFDRVLSIDPETGRIYTANYISALCYEPYGH